MKRANIGERNVAETVVNLVNEAAEELWKITPDLHLIFGLHATSVREQLDKIAKVDKRIEILWEDCGEFPYHYRPHVRDREKYENDYLSPYYKTDGTEPTMPCCSHPDYAPTDLQMQLYKDLVDFKD